MKYAITVTTKRYGTGKLYYNDWQDVCKFVEGRKPKQPSEPKRATANESGYNTVTRCVRNGVVYSIERTA